MIFSCLECHKPVDSNSKINPFAPLGYGPCCGRKIAGLLDNEMVKNNHYVSRFHTKSWEVGQRQLDYYDFENNKTRQKSSESLFAKYGLNSQEVEDWFKKHFEDIGGKFFPSFSVSNSNRLDSKQQKALYLMAIVQMARMNAKQDLKSYSEAISPLVKYSEEELDLIIHKFTSEVGSLLPVSIQIGVAIPEEVLFPIVFHNPNNPVGIDTVVAFPINSHHCGVFLKPEQEIPFREAFNKDPYLVSRSSIGVKSNKIVLPPFWTKNMANIEEWILQERKRSLELYNGLNQLGALINKAEQILKVNKDEK